MTTKYTNNPEYMSTEYSTIRYNVNTGLYTAEVIYPDGSEVTMQFESYEKWEKFQTNVNLPTMRYLYANG